MQKKIFKVITNDQSDSIEQWTLKNVYEDNVMCKYEKWQREKS